MRDRASTEGVGWDEDTQHNGGKISGGSPGLRWSSSRGEVEEGHGNSMGQVGVKEPGSLGKH